MLCTGRPYFLFTLNLLFLSLYLALLSHATAVPVCMCVTHSLPFYWFWNLLPFLFHFPTRHTIWLKVSTHIAFGRSFELAISEHKASLFRKAFVPSVLKISSLSSSRPDLPVVWKTFGRITFLFCSFLGISPWIFPLAKAVIFRS